MAIEISGPFTCESFGLCKSCFSVISAGNDMWKVTDDNHPREWESVCSPDCGSAREVSLTIAGDLESKATAIRRGQRT
jgi:hypothetical protein